MFSGANIMFFIRGLFNKGQYTCFLVPMFCFFNRGLLIRGLFCFLVPIFFFFVIRGLFSDFDIKKKFIEQRMKPYFTQNTLIEIKFFITKGLFTQKKNKKKSI